MSAPLIIANWKAQLTAEASAELVSAFASGLRASPARIIVCPAFSSLSSVGAIIKGTPMVLGAQDVSAFPAGPYTGEVPATLLKELGCQYVIIGHSERRIQLAESSKLISKKMSEALAADLIPIVCVGETAAERAAGETTDVIRRQVTESLEGTILTNRSLIIAYEPIWAIGNGAVVEPSDVDAVASLITATVAAHHSIGELAIIYGGSVTATNVMAYLQSGTMSGVLVGTDSLATDKFFGIVGALVS